MFKYDANLIPDVRLETEWKLEDGFINQVYRVGNWSFETSEEANLEYAEEAIYAWVAWYDFLCANKKLLNND